MARCSSRDVLRVLEERGPAEATVLAAALEVHPTTMIEQCYELQSDGYVHQVSGGVYAITDEGQQYLATPSE